MKKAIWLVAEVMAMVIACILAYVYFVSYPAIVTFAAAVVLQIIVCRLLLLCWVFIATCIVYFAYIVIVTACMEGMVVPNRNYKFNH